MFLKVFKKITGHFLLTRMTGAKKCCLFAFFTALKKNSARKKQKNLRLVTREESLHITHREKERGGNLSYLQINLDK